MDVRIRAAKAADYIAAEKLMKQVQSMHIVMRPDIYRETDTVMSFRAFSELIADGCLLAADEGGKLVGLCTVSEKSWSAETHVERRVLFVDSMVVDEAYRGQGIAHAFFDRLKELRDEKGLDGIELQVNAKNEAALRMYTDYGFTPKSINMELLEDHL